MHKAQFENDTALKLLEGTLDEARLAVSLSVFVLNLA